MEMSEIYFYTGTIINFPLYLFLVYNLVLGGFILDKIRILIVEDEMDISKFIQMELDYEGYITDVSFDGRDAIKKIEENDYDLLLLDVMLPSLSGIEILRRIRKASNIPVIIITAKDDVTDKVMGLDIGASDYITKPFLIEELLARIRVVIREQISEKLNYSHKFFYDGLVMDIERRTVKKDGSLIALTKNEFLVLEMLLRSLNQVVKREEIIAALWGDNFVGDSNAVDVYISHLRTKIDKWFDRRVILTIRGVGYTIKEDNIDT